MYGLVFAADRQVNFAPMRMADEHKFVDKYDNRGKMLKSLKQLVSSGNYNCVLPLASADMAKVKNHPPPKSQIPTKLKKLNWNEIE